MRVYLKIRFGMQTYSILTGRFCPPEGYVAFYKGQFLASARRIRARPRALYAYLLAMLEATDDHWLHL